MALDTTVVNALCRELSEKLTDGRIDKIHQPEHDEILIGIRTYTENYKLVLSASPAYPRIHFSSAQKENPMTPPMFCMLLRKHLSSGKIVRISQTDYERIICFDIESYNELGDLTTKHLIAELMGRNSNIILTDDNMKIIDSARHVDFTQSSVRQILPGNMYSPPPPQDKTPILSDEICSVKLDFSRQGITPEKVIMEKVSGIGPLTAREIVYRAIGTCGAVCGELSDRQKEDIEKSLRSGFYKEISPCMLTDESGKTVDFSAFEIRQYGRSMKITSYDSVSGLLDAFYKKRDGDERMKQKSAGLKKILHTHEERLAKKLIIQQKTLADAAKKEEYKIKGDLLTANIYRIETGAKSVRLENYYEADCPEIEVVLKPELSPSQNAQRYYKLYNKAKNAEIEVAQQMKSANEDLEYIKSTMALVDNCTCESDLNAIRAELAGQGFIKRVQAKKKQKKESVPKPMHFVSADGFDIYVGKNNTQNDYLTLKFANQQDLWFHTKQIHGSHTVIKLGTDKNVPDSTILEAAEIAAYYSQARESSNVPVDYTVIKNVKKPNGAKPGMVIYDSYNTLYVHQKNPEK